MRSSRSFLARPASIRVAVTLVVAVAACRSGQRGGSSTGPLPVRASCASPVAVVIANSAGVPIRVYARQNYSGSPNGADVYELGVFNTGIDTVSVPTPNLRWFDAFPAAPGASIYRPSGRPAEITGVKLTPICDDRSSYKP